jgi:hypothetical protein
MKTYPPLTPVEVYPLHGWDYDGNLYACQGGDSQYDWRCLACVEIASLDDADRPVMWKQDADTPEREVTLGWLVARSKALGVRR